MEFVKLAGPAGVFYYVCPRAKLKYKAFFKSF